MAQMLIYKEIVPLNREKHRSLRLQADTGFAFAAETHYVPVVGQEMPVAARDYPLLFSGDGEDMVPFAITGLNQGENVFVDSDGQWVHGAYVPAFLRRYPLVLAEGKDGGYTVCVDTTAKGLSEESGEPLFGEDGEETELLKTRVQFLQQYTAEMERTREFMKRLNELELLRQQDLQIAGPDNQVYRLRGFHMVDEEKLAALDAATAGELHEQGWLAWIYAHVHSLNNLARLQQRASSRRRAA